MVAKRESVKQNMAQKKLPTLSIIIPAFNEDKTILSLLKKVKSVKLPGIRKEIIIVNDGSTDKTIRLLGKIKMPHCKIFHHTKNKGKGAAIRTAVAHAIGDFFIIQDADLEYDPADYLKLLEPLLKSEADVVYGSRFLGVNQAFTMWNYLGNKSLTFFANHLYNTVLTDMETGYKVFRASVFRSLNLRSNRFNFDPEVTAKVLKKKFKLFEVPISYHGRDYENGKKINWWDGCMALFCLIRYRFID